MADPGLPALHHMLSLNNEHHWSNLLAALIDTDRDMGREVLGLVDCGAFTGRSQRDSIS